MKTIRLFCGGLLALFGFGIINGAPIDQGAMLLLFWLGVGALCFFLGLLVAMWDEWHGK